MAIGETAYVNSVREQLLTGRARLADVLEGREKAQISRLLNEVDEALQRINEGGFGICEECHTPIDEDWLEQNPLTTVCLEHMTPKQQRALEYDLELAAQIQKGLLPPIDFSVKGWEICYHYQPAGVVGGDYCDLIEGSHGELYFVMADVSGKGVAAAMLSSNLRAIFRSLIPMGLSTEELVRRANQLFRQSTLPTQYATLVCGKAAANGELEIVNAGHLPAMLMGESGLSIFDSTSQPLGVFENMELSAGKAHLRQGDTLVVYTDGISEAENDAGDEYGVDRLRAVIEKCRLQCPVQLIGSCKEHLQLFRGARERFDDETLLAIQYTPAATEFPPMQHAVA
jgi:sigma-B regulation protein RsbU (phosphoserine phosphatase)